MPRANLLHVDEVDMLSTFQFNSWHGGFMLVAVLVDLITRDVAMLPSACLITVAAKLFRAISCGLGAAAAIHKLQLTRMANK